MKNIKLGASKYTFTQPGSVAALNEISAKVCDSQNRRAEQNRVKNERAAKRRRIIDMLVLIALIIAIALVSLLAHAYSENSRFERAYALPRTEVVVHQGDTIDGIAATHRVDGLSDHELGYVIANISEGDYSTPLMPGDRLLVPMQSA